MLQLKYNVKQFWLHFLHVLLGIQCFGAVSWTSEKTSKLESFLMKPLITAENIWLNNSGERERESFCVTSD